MTTADLVLQGEARSVKVARQFLAATLKRWDAESYNEAATLVLSELVTNAALHARTEITVRLNLSPDGLRLEVADASTRPPVARHYNDQATTGRGLAMVDVLSQSWGVEIGAEGKVVWAELARDGSEPLADAEPEITPAVTPILREPVAAPRPPSPPAASVGHDQALWAAA